MKKSFIKITFILIVFSLLINPALYAKKSTGSVNLKGFSKFVESMLKEWDVPGAAVAIVKDGKIVFAQGFGYRDVDKKLNVTKDTLFAIGSCTKAFTATIMGILVDEGKVEWDKPVRNYLPSFKMYDKIASEQMTPVDLLTHRSGLPRHDSVWYGSSATRAELVNRLQYLEPSKSFRSTFQYNNLMFVTAGYLEEKLSGTPWEKLVQTKIFDPLGMKTSTLSVKDSQKTANFSLPYSKKEEKTTAVPFRNIDTVGPAGSINSSVAEMAQWILLNLNKGKVGDKQIISEGNLQQVHTPRMATGRDLPRDKELFSSTYGMGWFISTYQGHPVVSHGGGIDGFISNVSFLPRDNAGVVVLTNSDRGGNRLCSVIAYNVYDRILRMKQVPWSDRLKKRDEEAKKRNKKGEKKKDANRKPDTKPSHHLEAYAADYENPGYGIITVKEKDGKLNAVFNKIQFKGEHYHYDMFEISSDVMGGQKIRATFHIDAKGNIGSVTIPLQPGVKDIEFKRMPEKKGKDFLQKMVGTYDFSSGRTVKITLKGENTLVLNMKGQPPLDLVFYKGTEFNFKAFKGYGIKFILDDSGNVTGLESYQPNGTFTAKKVK